MNYVPKHNSNNKLDYIFTLPAYKSDALEIPIKVLRFDSLDAFESRNAYVKVGVGNFGTGYLHGIAKKTTTKLSYGADLLFQHSLYGPVDRTNSASNTSHAKLLGDYVWDLNRNLAFEVGYNFRRRHYYGYESKPTASETIRQDFQILESRIQYASRAAATHFKTDFSFHNWQNSTSQTERLATSSSIIFERQTHPINLA